MVKSAAAPQVSVAPDGRCYQLPSAEDTRAAFEGIRRQADLFRARGRSVVVVLGLGYVGAAVAPVIAATRDAAGEPLYLVIGVDLASPESYWKVARLNEGISPIVSADPYLGDLTADGVLRTGNLCATVSEPALAEADVIVVEIPQGVHSRVMNGAAEFTVDLRDFEQAIRTIGRQMRPEALVLVESTVPIGTCERLIHPVLQEEREARGMSAPVRLAYAYERVMPGVEYVRSIQAYWRTYAGIDAASAAAARRFLSSFVDTAGFPLWELDRPTAAELAKLLENSYRAMNIAFIHEWTRVAERLGVDLFTAIDSIRVRKGTHDNMRLPGFGVGGYCLPKDSLLAQWSISRWLGEDLRLEMTLQAVQINAQMPLHTVDLIREISGGTLDGRTVAVCGIAYLADVGDTRNSPAELLVDALADAGARLVAHDPYVSRWPERPWVPVVPDLADAVQAADVAVFTVRHQAYRRLDPQHLRRDGDRRLSIVDAQNVIDDEKAAALRGAGCSLLGVGKGHWRRWGYHRAP